MGIPAKINNAIFRVIILFLLIQFNVDNIYSQFSVAQVGNNLVGEPPYLGNGIPVFPARISISNDGKIIIAGAYTETATNSNAGAVYVNYLS